MNSRLLNFCTALSALCFLIVALFWLCSYGRSDIIGHLRNTGAGWRAHGIFTSRGSIGCLRQTFEFQGASAARDWTAHAARDQFQEGFHWQHQSAPLLDRTTYGFYAGTLSTTTTNFAADATAPRATAVYRTTTAAVPGWLVLMPTAILPALWLLNRRRLHLRLDRLRRQLCPECGYDLRSTPTRCPECGTIGRTTSEAPSDQRTM